ncbi:MAG: hypothetical protein KDB61_01655, partial [Planctomycetes bacterium]|nr:hypothetical protein [Planctomycetota bacterium]
FDNTSNTSSTFTGGGSCYVPTWPINQDVFWQWTAPFSGDFQIDTNTSNFDTQMRVCAGVGCTAVCIEFDDDDGDTFLQSKIHLYGVTAGDTFLIQVGGFHTVSGAGVLNISVDPCAAGAPDDMYDDNDSCMSPSPILPGVHTGLFVRDTDPDFYEITIPANDELRVDLLNSSYNVDFNVYNASCGLVTTDTGNVFYRNMTGAPETIILEVYANTFGFQPCTDYDLDISLVTMPPVPVNDDCSTAQPLSGTGTFQWDNRTASTSGFDGGGSCGAESATIQHDVFYQWTAPNAGHFSFDTFTTSFNTKMSLHAGVGCTATCAGYNDDTTWGQSEVKLWWLNAGDQVLIQLGSYATASSTVEATGIGVLHIEEFSDPCHYLAPDDSFEDNDSCGSPTPLPFGTHPNLWVSNADQDWYSFTIPAGHILFLERTNISGQVGLVLWDTGCSLIRDLTSPDRFVNTTGQDLDVIMSAVNHPNGGQTCTEYDLTIYTQPDPCQGPDDAFEDNDVCANATPVTNGVYTDLLVKKTDRDLFTTCVAPGATVSFDVIFYGPYSDVDAFLRLAGSQYCGTGNGLELLDFGLVGAGHEYLTWTNNTGANADVVLDVEIYYLGARECDTYDLVVAGSGCSGSAGTPFCDPATANSTGAPVVLTGTWGSGVGSDLHLDMTGGVVGQLAYMLVGNEVTSGFTVPGANGPLCLVGTSTAVFYRYNVLAGGLSSIGGFDSSGDWINASGTSTTGFGFDVPSMIPGTVPFAILAGDTWHFQGWYRDTPAGVGQSNFSNGLSVTF